MLGQNPGEGSSPVHQSWNVGYHSQLMAFAKDQLTFKDLNAVVGLEMSRWSIFVGKGIFRESGDHRVSLIPAGFRPSIHNIAYINSFPFKTIRNQRPLRTDFFASVWRSFVLETIHSLAPRLIIRFPDSDNLSQEVTSIGSVEEVVRVWHPSDYNLNTRRQELVDSWAVLQVHLPRSFVGEHGFHRAEQGISQQAATRGTGDTIETVVRQRPRSAVLATAKSGRYQSSDFGRKSERTKEMGKLDSFANQLEIELKTLLDCPVSVEIGGSDWVVNISPRNVELPGRVKKLVGVKPQTNGTLISVARAGFADCGLQEKDKFFGVGFSEEGSYMMLRIQRSLNPADIAPVIGEWLKSYVRTVGF